MNTILNTDSYKASHYRQYPPNTSAISAYVEARTGGEYDAVLFFGLQMFLKEYLARPVTLADIDDAESVLVPHGLPFNRTDWEVLVDEVGGYLPLDIEALPEGTVAPTGVPLVQIRNTDPRFFWLPTYIETALLRSVWYPSTVATVSWQVKQSIAAALEVSAEDWQAILPSRLHDFGARGTAALEQAGIGGLAHLVNFEGTDTLEALVYGRRFYGIDMAGFSIPAAEHSTMTSWGEAGEEAAYRNMVRQFAAPGKFVAVVSDSYDLFHAVDSLWGDSLKAEVEQSGGTVVVRPDSGDPTTIPLETIERLGQAYGFDVNAKGYKVLRPCIRVIQGDGVTPQTIQVILERLLAKGWSAENLAFGMGAGLLQKVNRDTLRFAMKANARLASDGIWHPVFKAPKTDPGKASKKGRQAVVRTGGRLTGVAAESAAGQQNQLRSVWRDGALLIDECFEDIRARAAA
ncbi:MAG: nicotinate phosphoribosyltransferase [Pseudomonadota bacterium]